MFVLRELYIEASSCCDQKKAAMCARFLMIWIELVIPILTEITYYTTGVYLASFSLARDSFGHSSMPRHCDLLFNSPTGVVFSRTFLQYVS